MKQERQLCIVCGSRKLQYCDKNRIHGQHHAPASPQAKSRCRYSLSLSPNYQQWKANHCKAYPEQLSNVMLLFFIPYEPEPPNQHLSPQPPPPQPTSSHTPHQTTSPHTPPHPSLMYFPATRPELLTLQRGVNASHPPPSLSLWVWPDPTLDYSHDNSVWPGPTFNDFYKLVWLGRLLDYYDNLVRPSLTLNNSDTLVMLGLLLDYCDNLV